MIPLLISKNTAIKFNDRSLRISITAEKKHTDAHTFKMLNEAFSREAQNNSGSDFCGCGTYLYEAWVFVSNIGIKDERIWEERII